jgi:plasmid stabilization system protein ParE
MIRLRSVPAVSADIAEAIKWYRRHDWDLGVRFSNEVYSLIEKIGLHPHSWSRVHGLFHRARLEYFPYHVYYRVHETEIVVLLVFHAARDPDAVRRLLRQREKPT